MYPRMTNLKISRLLTVGSLFLFLLSTGIATAQKRAGTEALQHVRKYIAEKNYLKAENQLQAHYRKNRNDLETNWLYGQVAHWNGHDKLSSVLFEQALKIAPDNLSLKLDYARVMYESGRLSRALALINDIKARGNTPVEALLLEANILFWYGKVGEAKSVIETIKQWYPQTTLINQLEKNIAELCATNIKSNFDYQSDNQPMSLFAEHISMEKYRSPLLNPRVEISNYNFSTKNYMLEFNMRNRFLLSRYGLSAAVSAGLYQHFRDKMNWTCSIDLQYKADKNNRFGMGINRKPYLGTLKSTEYGLIQNNISAEFETEALPFFTAHLGCNRQFFDDRNTVNSAGGWLISKAQHFKKFHVQYGYGFGYSNSERNVFEPTLPVAELIKGYTDGMTIAGIFNPYFTPQQQQVHSALLMLRYNPFQKLEIEVKSNYGFYASCNNPYFFLQKNSTGEIRIGKDFSRVRFNPYDIQASCKYHFSKRLDAILKYQYQETFFFSRNLTNLSLHYRL